MAKKSNKVERRFMGRMILNPEKGGAWLTGIKIYYEDGTEKDTWQAFKSVNAGKAWLKKKCFEFTGKKSIKFHASNVVGNVPQYWQGDVMYKVDDPRVFNNS